MLLHGKGSTLILLLWLVVGEIKVSSKRHRFEDVVGGVRGSWYVFLRLSPLLTGVEDAEGYWLFSRTSLWVNTWSTSGGSTSSSNGRKRASSSSSKIGSCLDWDAYQRSNKRVLRNLNYLDCVHSIYNCYLEQWFSTGVPQHTRVPWDSVRGAASSHFSLTLRPI